jgi:DNA invertase Pin-like site-specific DNA recombinase
VRAVNPYPADGRRSRDGCQVLALQAGSLAPRPDVIDAERLPRDERERQRRAYDLPAALAERNEPSMLSMEAIIYYALRNATGRLLFNRLGAIAQFETDIPAERQMDGIQKAKERGVHFGRKKRLTVQQVAELRDRWDQGALIKALMKEYSLSKASVYRYLSSTVSA